jgi:hypothetical protein
MNICDCELFTVDGLTKIIIVYFLMASFFIAVNYICKWLFCVPQKEREKGGNDAKEKNKNG